MPGNISDRMKDWPRVREALAGYPVRRVWEIFDKMLIDREKFILGNYYGMRGFGFLLRYMGGMSANLARFIETVSSDFDDCHGAYPLYPAEAGLPVLDSFSKIRQYGTQKYPQMHNGDWHIYDTIAEYQPELCYMTADAGGDNDGEFLNQYQLFEKLWNYLHYFGGICLYSDDRTYGIPYFETGSGNRFSNWNVTYSSYPYDDGEHNGLRFFHTPAGNDLEYKYIAVVNGNYNGSGDPEDTGVIQYPSGRNLLYESDWVRGAFVSPWIRENPGYDGSDQTKGTFSLSHIRMYIYPHFPDFYDPDTLEPMYLQ